MYRRYDVRVCPYQRPPLPKELFVHLHSFDTSGLHYTGAINLTSTRNKIPVKICICIFTCATTREVHLEVTPDVSAEAFIQTFLPVDPDRSWWSQTMDPSRRQGRISEEGLELPSCMHCPEPTAVPLKIYTPLPEPRGIENSTSEWWEQSNVVLENPLPPKSQYPVAPNHCHGN